MGFAQKDILFNEDQKWKLEQDVDNHLGLVTMIVESFDFE